MGSVIDYIECPRCKSENCVNDYYYKTDEGYTTCKDCGYYHSVFWKRDDDRNYVLKDPNGKTVFKNMVSEEVKIENPFGAFYVESTKGGGTGGTLESEKDYNEFVSHIVSLTNQPNEIKSASVSRFIKEKIVKEKIY